MEEGPERAQLLPDGGGGIGSRRDQLRAEAGFEGFAAHEAGGEVPVSVDVRGIGDARDDRVELPGPDARPQPVDGADDGLGLERPSRPHAVDVRLKMPEDRLLPRGIIQGRFVEDHEDLRGMMNYELRMMNGTDEGISKKEEVRSAVEIHFTDFMELQGRTQAHSTFIEWRSDTE